MGIFDKRKSISRRKFSSAFQRHHGRIPGTGGRKYYQREREKMVKEIFGPGYGSQIDKQEYRKALRDLEFSKRKAKTQSEKVRIDEKIRYLKELGGKSI